MDDRQQSEPPDYWWSELDEDALRAELAPLVADAEIVRAWTDEEEGPAFAELSDGRTLRFVGDGNATAWEAI
jgi:hypothetical protein